MPTITVGALRFEFPDRWRASQLDDWSFYRNQFQNVCGGSKAVDLVAFGSAECCWLIEVKDYRQRREKTLGLSEEIALKVRDSLACLAAASANANAPDEKTHARDALTVVRFRVVLHLEQPAHLSKLFPQPIKPADVLQRLKQLIKAIDPHPLVVEIGRLETVPWDVRRV